MSVIEIVGQVLKESILLLGQITLIIIAIMIITEFLQTFNILDKLTSLLSPITKFIGISSEGNLPILAGLLIGIGYGGAIIIDSTRIGQLKAQDIYLINLFLVTCHSLVEDTLLWAAIGAKVIPLQIGRFFLAVLLCYVVSFLLNRYCFNKEKAAP